MLDTNNANLNRHSGPFKQEDLCFLGIPILPVEAEVLCRLKISPLESDLEPELAASFIDAQRELARQLSILYKYGARNAPSDLWKAKEFDSIANNGRSHLYAGSDWLNTGNVYLGFGIFTGMRLGFLRTNRITKLWFDSFTTHRYWYYASLSYAAELLFEAGLVLYTALKPVNPRTHNWYYEQGTFWERCKNVLSADDRPTRIFNALLWVSINFWFPYISYVVNAGINLIGFFIDILVDIYKRNLELQKRQMLINAFRDREHDPACAALHPLLKFSRELVSKDYEKVTQDKKPVITATATLFFAMIGVYAFLDFWPQLFFSLIAAASGSVFAGIGKRIKNWFAPYFNKKTEPYRTVLDAASPSTMEAVAKHQHRSRTKPQLEQHVDPSAAASIHRSKSAPNLVRENLHNGSRIRTTAKSSTPPNVVPLSTTTSTIFYHPPMPELAPQHTTTPGPSLSITMT